MFLGANTIMCLWQGKICSEVFYNFDQFAVSKYQYTWSTFFLSNIKKRFLMLISYIMHLPYIISNINDVTFAL